MKFTNLPTVTGLAAALFGVASLVTSAAAAPDFGQAGSSASAVTQDIVTATETTTALTNALVAAVVSISDAVPMGTPASTIAATSEAVSLLVPECQDAIRLVDVSGDPLDVDNLPQDLFEFRGLEQLLNGAPLVQEPLGNELRTLVPLTSDMHANCMSCHENYALLPPGTLVGAAGLRIPL